MSDHFGENSNEFKNITGIGKSVDNSWIIEYNTVPVDIISKCMNVNGANVEIEDANVAPTD